MGPLSSAKATYGFNDDNDLKQAKRSAKRPQPPTIYAAERFVASSTSERLQRQQQYIQLAPSSITSASNLRQTNRSKSNGRPRTHQQVKKVLLSEETVRGCVRGTFTVGRQFTQCLVTTADIYQTECTARQHRGDDSLFLNHEEGIGPLASFEEDDEDNSVAEEETTQPAWAEILQVHSPPDIVNVARDAESSTPKRKSNHSQNRNCDSPVPAPRYRSYQPEPTPESQDTPNDEQLGLSFVESHAFDWWTKMPTSNSSSYTDLRELRLDMFKQDIDRKSGRMVPATQYNRAVHDLTQQSQGMQTLQQELDSIKQELSHSQQELLKLKDLSAQRIQASATASEKLFRERLEVETKLREEMKVSEALRQEASALREETKHLKNSLKNEKLASARRTASLPVVAENSKDNAIKEETKHACAVFQADVVVLKAQLAATRAARLSAEREKDEVLEKSTKLESEASALKEQVSKMKFELEQLRRKSDRTALETEDESKNLKEELDLVRTRLQESEQKALSEISRGKQLEEELTETHAQAIKLRDVVAQLLAEVEKSKEESSEQARTGEDETKKLQADLKRMKDKLAETNADIVAQAASHLKERQRLVEELQQARETVQKLQRKIYSMDDEIAAAEYQIESSAKENAASESGVSNLVRYVKMSEDVVAGIADKIRQKRSTGATDP